MALPIARSYLQRREWSSAKLATCSLNIGQQEAQCTGPSATRLCPEYTLWAGLQASSTCSVVGQIKAHFTALTRALLHSLAKEVARTPLSILYFSLILNDSQKSLTLLNRLMTSLDSHVQNFKDKRLNRQTGQMSLLWVAVFHYSAECATIILVVGWRAACWSHSREGPVACQRSWSKWEGKNAYCFIFCFLSLRLHLLAATWFFFCFFNHVLLGCIINTFFFFFF